MNSYTLHLVTDDPHAVVLLTADPLSLEKPNVHRREQKDVPADALWLIVPTPDYRAPSTIWGQIPERHNHQTMPIDPDTQESDDSDERKFVKERMTDERVDRIALWLYLGLFVPGFFGLYAKLIPHFSLPIMAFVVWFVVFVIALFAALLHLAFAAFRAWWWRRRDDQTRRDLAKPKLQSASAWVPCSETGRFSARRSGRNTAPARSKRAIKPQPILPEGARPLQRSTRFADCDGS